MSVETEAGKPPITAAQRSGGRTSRNFAPAQRLALIQAAEAYAGSVEDFCKQQGISSTTLYNWRNAFRAHGATGLEKGMHGPKAKRRTATRQYTPEQRREAVEGLAKSELTQQAYAKIWGVTPRILRIWVKAYAAHGPKGLEGRPGRKPGKVPVPPTTSAAIIAVKTANPLFGLRKVRDFLARFQGVKASAPIIRRVVAETPLPTGLVPVKRRVMRPKPRRFERAAPGQLWQSDITSMTCPRSGTRVNLVAFLDDHSRYVVSWKLAHRATTDLVQECLLEGISRFGKPEQVLTDQGPQYFSWRGKSPFQKLLLKLGIQHVVARTHHPQTVGKCERLWATLKEELWGRVAVTDLLEGQVRLAHFFAHYNHFRTHQGMDGSVPADRFFGVDAPVRQAIEAQLAKNELAIALGEAPRSPVFLVGQIGGYAVSLHGERGTLVFQTADGVRQELAYDALGMAQGRPAAQEDPHGHVERDHSDTNGGAHAPATGNASADAPGDPGCGQTEGRLRDAAAGVAGEGAVGGGERAGAGSGASDGGVDARALAGTIHAGGVGPTDRAAAGADLADEPAGAVGDGGGVVEAAADAAGGDAPAGAQTGGRSEGAAEAGGGAGAQERDPGGPGPDPAGVADDPGRSDDHGDGDRPYDTAREAEGEKKPGGPDESSEPGSGTSGASGDELTGPGWPGPLA